MRVLFSISRSVWRLVKAALLFLYAVTGCRSAGAAPAPPQEVPARSAVATWHFAIADFDGDSQPDVATVQAGEAGGSETRYWIRFQLSTGSHRAIGVRAPVGGLQIAPRDVNGDNILDLVVTTAWLNRPVAVLLNDGYGNFTLNDPGAFPRLVWGSETSWTPAGTQLKDTAAVVSSRYVPGDCEEGKGISSPLGLPGALASGASRIRAFLPGIFVLGRAPPPVVHHV
jgi:hypothetical protein